jgi:hypothetical protein
MPKPEISTKRRNLMKIRNKIASMVLFLTAVVIAFDAQPSWSAFTGLPPGYSQCDVATGFTFVIGMVALSDGTVLVGDLDSGLYSIKPNPGQGTNCQSVSSTLLTTGLYRALAIGLDGKIYANGRNGGLFTLNQTTWAPTAVPGISGVMYALALDPATGDLFARTGHHKYHELRAFITSRVVPEGPRRLPG